MELTFHDLLAVPMLLGHRQLEALLAHETELQIRLDRGEGPKGPGPEPRATPGARPTPDRLD